MWKFIFEISIFCSFWPQIFVMKNHFLRPSKVGKKIISDTMLFFWCGEGGIDRWRKFFFPKWGEFFLEKNFLPHPNFLPCVCVVGSAGEQKFSSLNGVREGGREGRKKRAWCQELFSSPPLGPSHVMHQNRFVPRKGLYICTLAVNSFCSSTITVTIIHFFINSPPPKKKKKSCYLGVFG